MTEPTAAPAQLSGSVLTRWQSTTRSPGVWLVVAFQLLALVTLVTWQLADRNEITGDEGHYLVMASGIVEHGTLEQTVPYEAEFESQHISEFPFAPPGAKATEDNTHGVNGPNGLFNIHGLGLPAVVAGPFWVGGPFGAKVVLVLLAGLAVWSCWVVSGLLLDDRRQRLVAVAVVTFGLPLIPASNQIYPEVIGGVIALAAIARLWWRRSTPDRTGLRFGRIDGAVLASVALLPWLHIKFAPVAVVLVVALALFGRTNGDLRDRRCARRRALFVAPIVVSGLLLAAYNAYAFGSPTGPYEGGNVAISPQALTVLAGLYLDQFQGMLWQNLALFVALPFVVSFIRRNPVVGGLIAIVHLLFVLPNAFHVNWFGGFSFAGRFGWGGAIVAMPIAIFAIGRIFELAPRRWAIAVTAVLGALQLRSYLLVTLTDFDLYNRFEFPAAYPSLAPLPRAVTPILVDSSFAVRYAPNLVFVVIAVLLIAVGWHAVGERVRRMAPSRAGAVAVLTVAVIAVTGVLSAFPGRQAVYAGGDLQTVVGERVDRSIEASDETAESGVVSFGPYINLEPGRYRFVLTIDADNDGDAPIGSWDIVSSAVPDPLQTGVLDPTLSALRVEIDVTDATAGTFQIRTLWTGEGELRVDELTIDRL